MKIGFTGHQQRPGINWNWVKEAITDELRKVEKPLIGLSSLAKGADQIFAESVLTEGGSLRVIIPTKDYAKYFEGAVLERYHFLIEKAEIEKLDNTGSDQEAFMAAGQHIVDSADRIITVWDGKPAQGLGGTADIVQYAHMQGKHVTHINPILRQVLYFQY
ncbi:hypothetical protein IQ268_17035 [Oculatella sp. LEGE 06141]|uniref:hypothetical protein n=1 Tax=Oculatella sp. LEGE 06141 TaxID=1828648 RepID=UPI00187DEA21|nr:hypothetical protein [Oculatella sp. LEGE 06141]MBE9180270.1 hypothetical protein [Oculatella sp. LEGE 06141]